MDSHWYVHGRAEIGVFALLAVRETQISLKIRLIVLACGIICIGLYLSVAFGQSARFNYSSGNKYQGDDFTSRFNTPEEHYSMEGGQVKSEGRYSALCV
jgi:hypothetical protein